MYLGELRNHSFGARTHITNVPTKRYFVARFRADGSMYNEGANNPQIAVGFGTESRARRIAENAAITLREQTSVLYGYSFDTAQVVADFI